MTSATHLARTEVRRLSRTGLGRAAIVAVLLVPLMYGALYLWAFWDPYGRLDAVPVALVDQDRAVQVDRTRIAAGQELERTLRERGGFDWHVVDAREAAEGLDAGRYYLVVTVPSGFSAALASPAQAPAGATGDAAPRRAVLDVRTDDANGYLAGQLSRSVLLEVRQALGSGSTKAYVRDVYASLAGLHGDLDRAASGAGDLAAGSGEAEGGSTDLARGTGSLADGARDLAAGADRLRAGTASLTSGAARADAGADRLAAGTTRLTAGGDELASGLRTLDGKTAALPGATRALADGAASLARGNADLAAALQRSAAGTDAVGKARSHADAAVHDAVVAFLAAHPGDPSAQALAATIGQELAAVDGAAQAATDRAAAASAALRDGAATLATRSDALADATPALATGVHRARLGAGTLSGGLHEAAAGSHDLAAGTSRLASGTRTLASGTATLASSSHRLAAGAAQAADGAADLHDGLVRLDGGATTLADRLRAGAGQVPVYDGADAETRAAVVAEPVDLRKDPLHVAATYGAGFAPYFIPLSLWVGGVVAYLLLRPLAPRALASGARAGRVALGGWLPAAVVGVGQALVLFAVLHWAIGLDAVHPVAMVGFLALTATAFTALLQWVNAQFGTPGKLIAIALLILQLTSAGGTYPIETAPRFFQAIHPWLPMTYVVTGLRHLISGGPAGAVWQAAGVLTGITIACLALTTLTARRRRTWTVARLHPELSL
ncbi:MAG: YhgE/Pip domain-containing protein [Kineosporiaceae bacterium]